MAFLKKHKTLIVFITGVVSLIIAFALNKVDPSIYAEFSWSSFSDTAFYSSLSFISFILYTSGYLILVIHMLPEVIEEFKEHHFFNEGVLMLVATIGAYALCEFPEAIFVLSFAIVGEMLEDLATDKAKNSIRNLVNSMPLVAHVISEDGAVSDAEPKEVEVGALLEVKPGEKVALDGVLEEGKALLDLSSLTGESLPTEIEKGGMIVSGGIVLSSPIHLRVTKRFEDGTLQTIMHLVEEEEKNKSKSEKFITKFSSIYTPLVILISLLVFLIGYGFSGFVWEEGGREWLYKALSILLISCPCALVISVPIAFFSGIGVSSKMGILIKGSISLENLSRSKTFIFDKTGTLTKGKFTIENTCEEENLKIAASLEAHSNHPLGKAIREKYTGPLYEVENLKDITGYGLAGEIGGKKYLIGSEKMMREYHLKTGEIETPYQVLYLADETRVIAHFILKDEVKEEAKEMILSLKKEGVKDTEILSGDREDIAEAVASETGVDKFKGNLLPDQKLGDIKALSNAKNLVSYVGDGINDSPALLAADVGIAMGGLGSDAAIEASDVVILDDDLNKIPEAKRISKKTMFTVYTAVLFSLLFKVVVMVLVSLGIFGAYTMIVASLSDTLVMALAVSYVMVLMLYKPRYIKKK